MRGFKNRLNRLRAPEIMKPCLCVMRSVNENVWRRDDDETKAPITDEDLTRLEQEFFLIKVIVHEARRDYSSRSKLQKLQP